MAQKSPKVTSFKKNEDLLAHIKHFHEQLSQFYESLREATDKPRVEILVEYLRRKKENFEESIREYHDDTGSENVLKRWFKYLPELQEQIDNEIAKFEIKPDITVDEVVEMTMSFNDFLIEIYGHVAERSNNDDVQKLFTRLLEREEREKRRLAKDVALFKDI